MYPSETFQRMEEYTFRCFSRPHIDSFTFFRLWINWTWEKSSYAISSTAFASLWFPSPLLRSHQPIAYAPWFASFSSFDLSQYSVPDENCKWINCKDMFQCMWKEKCKRDEKKFLTFAISSYVFLLDSIWDLIVVICFRSSLFSFSLCLISFVNCFDSLSSRFSCASSMFWWARPTDSKLVFFFFSKFEVLEFESNFSGCKNASKRSKFWNTCLVAFAGLADNHVLYLS